MKTRITREALHNTIYISGLALLVTCLPLSRYVLSISQFILILNWLAEGGFAKKAALLRRKPAVLLVISILLVYLAGMLYTRNIPAGMIKVRNVLPLAMLPVIMATTAPLSKKNVYRILLLFTVAVMAAALICLFRYFSDPAPATRDFRKISLFIPHIRFALLIITAVYILLYRVFFKPVPIHFPEQAAFTILSLLLVAFLFVLRSFAGIILLFLTAGFFVIRIPLAGKSRLIRFASISAVVITGAVVIFFIARVEIKDFHAPVIDPAGLEKRTAGGNEYEHDLFNKTLENGHYVGLYVCEPELRKEWNAISQIPYDSVDQKGQSVSYTIQRYLTSKGLRKDSAAIHMLNKEDIQAIEKGRANYRFSERPGLYQRLYETLWEIHMWRNTGFVQQHSFGQRLVFLRTAGTVIRNNFWTGVGTGDVYDIMMKTTRDNGEAIEKRWKGEPHNQFAFFLMAFGIFGFVWILFSLIYPAWNSRSYRYLLFNLFSAIMLISMMILDTIESYDNMVFFVFFYSLFVFGSGNLQKKPEGQI
jgi:hypothetical protein